MFPGRGCVHSDSTNNKIIYLIPLPQYFQYCFSIASLTLAIDLICEHFFHWIFWIIYNKFHVTHKYSFVRIVGNIVYKSTAGSRAKKQWNESRILMADRFLKVSIYTYLESNLSDACLCYASNLLNMQTRSATLDTRLDLLSEASNERNSFFNKLLE